jgi:hypothetical protein
MIQAACLFLCFAATTDGRDALLLFTSDTHTCTFSMGEGSNTVRALGQG